MFVHLVVYSVKSVVMLTVATVAEYLVVSGTSVRVSVIVVLEVTVLSTVVVVASPLVLLGVGIGSSGG